LFINNLDSFEACLSKQFLYFLFIGKHIFDEYRGSGVEGRSVAWRLVFRAPDRTLRDAEVDEALARVVDALKERLGVEQRGA